MPKDYRPFLASWNLAKSNSLNTGAVPQPHALHSAQVPGQARLRHADVTGKPGYLAHPHNSMCCSQPGCDIPQDTTESSCRLQLPQETPPNDKKRPFQIPNHTFAEDQLDPFFKLDKTGPQNNAQNPSNAFSNLSQAARTIKHGLTYVHTFTGREDRHADCAQWTRSALDSCECYTKEPLQAYHTYIKR